MDFFIELLFGLFVEVPLDAAMESKRLKTWVKTVLMSLLCSLPLLLIGFACVVNWKADGWYAGTLCLCAILMAGVAFSIWMIRDGHKRKWVQKKYF